MSTDMPDQPLMEDPHAPLERTLITEYLRDRGYTLEDLRRLPEEIAKRLMKEASLYASVRLAEVETRARLVHDVHGTSPRL